ncbi:MAG: oligosaccharide flippase family protein [Phycisphaeraceae bacterium]|nr:MAG: oligosaccharide flippase family protein [Phycisphaeraceae bacterium]
MSSEAKRGAVRIAANYTRLLTNVVLGLVSVKILVEVAGDSAFGLVSTLGATTGIANLTEETVRRSMIRELGSALHNEDRSVFTRVFNTALLLAGGMSMITLSVFGLIMLCLWQGWIFEIDPPSLIEAAYWLVAWKAAESVVDVLLSPIINVYIASERMRAFNGWMMLQRLARLSAALGLFFYYGSGADPATALKTYAMVGAILYISANLTAALTMMLFVEGRTRPRPWLARRSELPGLVTVGKWNMAMSTAQNLHLRADQIITNSLFGLIYNTSFGLAMQLTSYVRMLTVGMTDGLDAVTARLSIKKGEESVRDLVRHSTRLHAFVSIPTGIGMLILAEPALDVWVGANLQNRAMVISRATIIMQIIVLGVTLRAISDGWIRILYGAGHIRSYALPIVALSFLNPVVAIVLAKTMPADVAYLGPPIAFSLVTAIISAGVVPLIGGRCLGVSPWALAAPIVRPGAVAIVSAPILVLAIRYVPSWNLLWLGATCGAYAVVVTVLCVRFAMTQQERQRFSGAIMRRLGRGGGRGGRGRGAWRG